MNLERVRKRGKKELIYSVDELIHFRKKNENLKKCYHFFQEFLAKANVVVPAEIIIYQNAKSNISSNVIMNIMNR